MKKIIVAVSAVVLCAGIGVYLLSRNNQNNSSLLPSSIPTVAVASYERLEFIPDENTPKQEELKQKRIDDFNGAVIEKNIIVPEKARYYTAEELDTLPLFPGDEDLLVRLKAELAGTYSEKPGGEPVKYMDQGTSSPYIHIKAIAKNTVSGSRSGIPVGAGYYGRDAENKWGWFGLQNTASCSEVLNYRIPFEFIGLCVVYELSGTGSPSGLWVNDQQLVKN